jgi:hypothetical protein
MAVLHAFLFEVCQMAIIICSGLLYLTLQVQMLNQRAYPQDISCGQGCPQGFEDIPPAIGKCAMVFVPPLAIVKRRN